VRAGLDVIGVPTSEATRADAQRVGVTLTTLDETPHLDLTVDGADEIGPGLALIKGGGGALLREKIVAAASDHMIVIADDTKWCSTLGQFPLPVEVVSFGWPGTADRLKALGVEPRLRLSPTGGAFPLTTDNGGYILDCHTGPIADPVALGAAIKGTTGVVDHGLFLGVATEALQVNPAGEIVRRERNHT